MRVEGFGPWFDGLSKTSEKEDPYLSRLRT